MFFLGHLTEAHISLLLLGSILFNADILLSCCWTSFIIVFCAVSSPPFPQAPGIPRNGTVICSYMFLSHLLSLKCYQAQQSCHKLSSVLLFSATTSTPPLASHEKPLFCRKTPPVTFYIPRAQVILSTCFFCCHWKFSTGVVGLFLLKKWLQWGGLFER